MKKVMIIEDNLDIREMYTLKLKNYGYDVVEAEDGEKGLSLLKSEAIDLLLLDIMLPKKDGYDIMKEINSSKNQMPKIPIIIISNLSSNEDVNEAKRLGAVDYFVKSELTPEAMLNKVNDFFTKKC